MGNRLSRSYPYVLVCELRTYVYANRFSRRTTSRALSRRDDRGDGSVEFHFHSDVDDHSSAAFNITYEWATSELGIYLAPDSKNMSPIPFAVRSFELQLVVVDQAKDTQRKNQRISRRLTTPNRTATTCVVSGELWRRTANTCASPLTVGTL